MKWVDRLSQKQVHLMFLLSGIVGLICLVFVGRQLDVLRAERMNRWFTEHGYEAPNRLESSSRRACDDWIVTAKDGGSVHRFRDCRHGDPEQVW